MKPAKEGKIARAKPGISKRKLQIAIALSLIFAAVGGGGVIWSSNGLATARSHLVSARSDASARRTEVLKVRVAAAAAATAAADAAQAASFQASQDAMYAVAGLKPAGAGSGIYYKFADSGTYSCGYFSCTYVFVLASKGCNSGVYIAASILRNGTSIGLANGISAGLPVGGTASVLLQDTSNGGNTFSLTDVHCMG